MIATAVVSWGFPTLVAPPKRPGLSDLKAVLLDPVLLPLMGIVALHGMTLTAYDSLFSLHVERLGMAPWVTGAAMSMGVTVEVGVLLFGRPLLDRIGPMRLLLVAVVLYWRRVRLTH